MMRRAICLFGSLAVVACEREAPPDSAEVVRPVRYEKVVSSGGGRSRQFSGNAHAGVESVLSFKVRGGLRSLDVNVGDHVDKGQIIASLDPVDYELQVQEARAALDQGAAQQRNAKASYDRVRTLYESSNASRSQLDSARAGSESASAAVSSIRKRLAMARNQLEYTRLKAPQAGAIAAVLVEKNENVQAGQPIVKLAGGGAIKVKIGVPEVLIANVNQGSSAKVTFPALEGRVLEAKVTEVGVAPTGAATTFGVTLELAGDTSSVRSGMAAVAELAFNNTDDRERFVVPTFAVREDRNGRFAFVLADVAGELGVVRRRTVEVGELRSGGLEVFSGLADGDLLITAGVTRIQDGMKVRVLAAHEVVGARGR